MPIFYRILVGCAIITIVALVSDRSRLLAGILSTAPINIPVILWVIWGGGKASPEALQKLTGSMLLGLVPLAGFIAACWYGFSQRWHFAATLGAGYLIWGLGTAGTVLLRRLLEQ
jgi:uncharacterized membrane protein (GlpM family)